MTGFGNIKLETPSLPFTYLNNSEVSKDFRSRNSNQTNNKNDKVGEGGNVIVYSIMYPRYISWIPSNLKSETDDEFFQRHD